jgi:serine acetyltransferase
VSAAAVRLARALDRWRMRACDVVGADLRLEGPPWISNRGRLVVGGGVRISSRPVQSHLVVAPGASLVIGDGVEIGHGAAIAAHARVEIGEGARLGPFVSISDTDFHVAGERDGVPETAPVRIGAGARLGSRVTVLRGSSIGRGAVVLAGSVVSGPVADGAVVSGVPARPTSGAGADHGDPPRAAERVPQVVAEALGLRAPPPEGAGPAAIPEWDSLGALRILLALEDAFAVTLDERSVAGAATVADLARAVDAALQARQRSAA